MSGLIVEADGASRGNPGPAAYGALLRDAETGEMLATAGVVIGHDTNNAAEYEGLIAGLGLAADQGTDAPVEVRMDSKLVVEQMKGTWRIKKPELAARADRARQIASRLAGGVTYTWIPREQNSEADALANAALDGEPSPSVEPVETTRTPSIQERARGWSPDTPITTLILVRHGVTDLTRGKRFSGGLEGSNPPLNDEGREQIRAAAEWLAPADSAFAAVVASPVARTWESGQILAERMGLELEAEPALAELDFGSWDGSSFDEVGRSDPDGLHEWLASVDAPAGGTGESVRQVQSRAIEGVSRIEERFAGKTVVVASHATPIKSLLVEALGAPLESVHTVEVTPGSVSIVAFRGGDAAAREAGPPRGLVRLLGALPPARDAFASGPDRW